MPMCESCGETKLKCQQCGKHKDNEHPDGCPGNKEECLKQQMKRNAEKFVREMENIEKEAKQYFEEQTVVYCSRCQMWFDVQKGWKSESSPNGLPLCPACLAPLFEMPFGKFKENNKHRWDEMLTWEWPNGSFWDDKKERIKEGVRVAKQRMQRMSKEIR